MVVFKFGGASVQDAERVRSAERILRLHTGQKIMVVISAMGKTTNALEEVAVAFFKGNRQEALDLFHAVRDNHLEMASLLLLKELPASWERLSSIFTEVEWLLHDRPVRGYDYYYDQIVCIGELLSTTIVHAYLKEQGHLAEWMDVRDIIRTDDHFRDAGIDWAVTAQQTASGVLPLFRSMDIVVTQGFIGSTDENESTTLGREGSDYSAAVFANLLDAENLTIWKDVEGVMSADPKLVPEAVRISELDYSEIIEMAYYGAQVIHPKTIKPLQNKKIKLLVKCFSDPSLPGTVIHEQRPSGLPPIIVWKHAQALLHLHSKDFSFVGEQPMAKLYGILDKLKLKPNLIQSGAVSVQLCLDEHPEKIDRLCLSAADIFDVEVEKGLSLLTIRHYSEDVIQRHAGGKNRMLSQQTPETVQMLFRK